MWVGFCVLHVFSDYVCSSHYSVCSLYLSFCVNVSMYFLLAISLNVPSCVVFLMC